MQALTEPFCGTEEKLNGIYLSFNVKCKKKDFFPMKNGSINVNNVL